MDDRAPNSVKKPIQDLREWLARVEEIGELVAHRCSRSSATRR